MTLRRLVGGIAAYVLASVGAGVATLIIFVLFEGPYEPAAARFVATELLLSSFVATFFLGLPLAILGAELLRWRGLLRLRTAVLLANALAAVIIIPLALDPIYLIFAPAVVLSANILAMCGWLWFYRPAVAPSPA